MYKLKDNIVIIICTFLVSYSFSNTLPEVVYVDEAVEESNRFSSMKNIDTGTYHFITHGRPGYLLVEGQWMNANQIAAFLAPKIQNSKFKNLNIYGCEFAKGQKGKQAVAYLEHKLGVIVAASTNVTGIDGDYLLEVGNMDASTLFGGFQGNLQLTCSPDYGIVPGPTNQYASNAYGGYPSGNYGSTVNDNGIGVPDGSGIAIYNNALTSSKGTQYQGRFIYSNIFSGGSTVVITAKYIDSRHDGVTLEFSADYSTWVGLTPVINGFTSNYTNVTYTLPSTLRGQYKYIRVQGVSANTYLNIDAIRTNVGVCNTCPARLDAPVLSSTTVTTACPSQTYSLNTITASNTPANTVLTWHEGTPATNANKIANPSAVATGVYYAAFYNSANNCYSGANGSATTQVKTVGNADCDGVLDANDLDDDNDGVLDVDEGHICISDYKHVLINRSTVGTNNYGINGNAVSEFENYYPNPDATINGYTTLQDPLTNPDFYSGYELVVIVANDTEVHDSHWTALKSAILNNKSKAFAFFVDGCCNSTNNAKLVALLNNLYGTNYASSGNPGSYYYGYFQQKALNTTSTYHSLMGGWKIPYGSHYSSFGNTLAADVLSYSDDATNPEAYIIMKKMPNASSNSNFVFASADATQFQTETNSGNIFYGRGNKGKIAPAFYNTLAYESIPNCTEKDTDGDGISNHLDLDSDGDGCSDALESGVTNSTTKNFTYGSDQPDNNDNGFNDTLETKEKGKYDGKYTYFYAIDKRSGKCLSEICDDGIDNDADGAVDYYDDDCYEVATCTTEQTVYNFQIEKEGCSPSGSYNNYQTPMVADIDQDGVSDIVAFDTGTNTIKVLNSTNLSVKYSITNPDGNFGSRPNSLALGQLDGTGYLEIVYVTSNNKLVVLQHSGGTWKKYISGTINSTVLNLGSAYTNGTALADFNQDGTPEIYLGNQIFSVDFSCTTQPCITNVVNGMTVGSSYGNIHAPGGGYSIAYDIMPNSECNLCDGLELIAGNQVYAVDIATGQAELVRNINVPGNDDDGPTAIADMNLDGVIDVVVAAGSSTYVWTPKTSELLFTVSSSGQRAIPFVANVYNEDLADDGEINNSKTNYPELIVLIGSAIHAYNIHSTTPLFTLSTTDISNATSMVAFDFNGDGNKEIVYRDQTDIRIIYGGPEAYKPEGVDANRNYAKFSCTSGSGWEHPVVADIDNDDEAEIVASCGSQICVFGSVDHPWMPARKIWNQVSYNVVNVNDDGTIPAYQQSILRSFNGDSNYLLNNFNTQLNPLEIIAPRGQIAAPDIFVPTDGAKYTSETDADGNIVSCPDFEIEYQITNGGSTTMVDDIYVYIYDSDPEKDTNAKLIYTGKTTQSIPVGATVTETASVSLSPNSIPSNIYIVLNTNPNMTVLIDDKDYKDSQPECSFGNNIYKLTFPGCKSTDGDIIPDYADLDIDNDGILNAIESPDCFYTEAAALKLVSVSTEITSSDDINSLLTATSSSPAGFNFNNNQNVSQKNIITLELTDKVELASLSFNMNNTNSFLNSSNTTTPDTGSYTEVILRGSLDGVNWVNLSESVFYDRTATGSVETFTITQNRNTYKYYQLYGSSSNGNTYSSGNINYISFQTANYNQSLHLKPTCTNDTDKDDILNHLDLDSDGDGCPDALEGGAGFDTSVLKTSEMPGGNTGSDYLGISSDPVVDNLGKEVDEKGVPTIANGGQAVGTSQDVGKITSACENCQEITGTVTDSSGNPIENGEIKVYADFDNNGDLSSGDVLLEKVSSDNQGKYIYNKEYYLTTQDNFEGSVFSGTNNSSGNYNAWIDNNWSQSNTSSGISTSTNTDDGLASTQHIYIHNGTKVFRTVNLSKYNSAFLSFDFDTENELDTADAFYAEISTDGGTTFNTVYTYTDDGTDNQPVRSVNINISEYAGEGNVTLQFRTETGDTEYVWIDNVNIYTEFPSLLLKPRLEGEYKGSSPSVIAFDPTSGSCDMKDFELLSVCDIDPTDKDGDGICNGLDIDDDNDGVLDETEGNFCGEIDRNIIVGYVDSGVGKDGLATDMLLNLNNFGEYGTYNKVNGIVLVPFSSSSEVTEANLLANNIDIFFAGSSVDDSTASGHKLSTETNTTLKNWAETHDKGLFILQNNAVDYGYTLTNNDVPPDVPNGEKGEQVYTYGYWPVTSISQTGDVKMTISSISREFDAIMVDSKNNPTVVKDDLLKLIIFPDATIYNAEANTVDPNTNNATKVIADTWAYVIDTFIAGECTEINTDGDGEPNHLDLDSDNDGCPDAFEAGATDQNSPNFQFMTESGTSTDSNSDGLADVVDANLNHIPDYVSTYKELAIDGSNCKDSDGDTIVDSIDIDDDNDGILDTDEGLVCMSPEQGKFRIGYVDTTVGKTGLMQNMLTNADNFGPTGTYDKIPEVEFVPYAINNVTEEQLLEDNIDVFYLGSSVDGTALNQTGSNSYKLPSTLNRTVKNWMENHNKAVLVVQNNAIDFGYRIVDNNENPNTSYGPTGESVMVNGYWPVSMYNQSGTVKLTSSSSTENYNVVMTDNKGKATLLSSNTFNMVLLPDATILDENSSRSTVSSDILKVVANIHAYIFDLYLDSPQCEGIDTDNDGISNHLDLDSDGDGCADIKEAGIIDHLSDIGEEANLTSGEVVNGNNVDDSENTTSTMENAKMEVSNDGDSKGPNNGFHDILEQNDAGKYDGAPYDINTYLDPEIDGCRSRKTYSNPAKHTYEKPKKKN